MTTKYNANVYLGQKNNKETFRLGRVHFHINWAFYGFVRYANESPITTTGQRIVIFIGGPLVSLCIGVFGFISSTYMFDENSIKNLMTGVGVFNIYLFLLTILPIRYPEWWKPYSNMPSDGYRILQEVKRKNEMKKQEHEM
ncbi:hypothetical protein L1611_10265 [Alkalihalobacillus sp. EGI L200015]|nr:hypothetical protein [Pseudalkalibacillus salsuginis]